MVVSTIIRNLGVSCFIALLLKNKEIGLGFNEDSAISRDFFSVRAWNGSLFIRRLALEFLRSPGERERVLDLKI